MLFYIKRYLSLEIVVTLLPVSCLLPYRGFSPAH